MFSKKSDPVAENLDTVIDAHILKMSELTTTHSEYPAMVDQLVKLYSLRPQAKAMSSDVKATIAANLAGILLIIGHERTGVITTKALGFIQKLR